MAVYLLRRTADESFGVQYCVQLPENGGKIGVFLDPGQQVIVPPFLFDHRCCLLGQNTDFLVAVLQGAERRYSSTKGSPDPGQR